MSQFFTTGCPTTTQCCPPTNACPPTAADIVAGLNAIACIETDIRNQLITLSNGLFTNQCPVFVRDETLKACIDALDLPVSAAGTWDSQDADDTGLVIAAAAWQAIRVINPSTNSLDATVDIGGNVRTISPTTLADPTLGIVEIAFPYFVASPIATITAGAAETVVVEILNF